MLLVMEAQEAKRKDIEEQLLTLVWLLEPMVLMRRILKQHHEQTQLFLLPIGSRQMQQHTQVH